ncbi:hypothetical protein ISS05_04285 [Candidatus Woesearchaeota archaeon]|nr:hypothetical protein [Candidatus Woesearchaeota archaeon]
MKSIVFDAGPIISLAINDLLWLLEPLKKRFKGNFYISKGIKQEIVDKPLKTKRFKFEALKVLNYIENGTISIVDNEDIRKKTELLLDLANNSFIAHNHPINIVHYGEMSGIATAILNNSDAYAVDERTTRTLIENPDKLKNILRHTLHTRIKIDYSKLKEFQKLTKNIKVIRSVELVTIAYELGLLDKYLVNTINPRQTLLESVLWGVKLNGCAVSKREIEQILKIENKR